MPAAQVAASHYEPDGYGDARKICINCYPERNPADPNRPVKLVSIPGSEAIDFGRDTDEVRGFWQQDGVIGGNLLYINDGVLYSWSPGSPLAGVEQTGLPGSDRVQFTASQVEIAILIDGDIYIYTSLAGAAVVTDGDFATLLSDHNQTAFTSIDTIGQRLVFSYGSRWGFSAALDFDNTTTLSFYTAESLPDAVVALKVFQNLLYVFGTNSCEVWTQTGNNDDPFQPIQGREIPRGLLARDTIVELDQTLIWIADNYEVHRLAGNGSRSISPPWVAKALRKEDPADIICSRMEMDGHAFYIINTPSICMVYDAAWAAVAGDSDAWTVRKSRGSETWRWCWLTEIDGVYYGATRGGSNAFCKFARSRFSEFELEGTANRLGTEIVREFTAHLPVMGGRSSIPSIRLDGAKGVGTAYAEGVDPLVEMRISRDSGNTWTAWRERSVGPVGEYGRRAVWNQNGRACEQQVVLHFRTSSPALMVVNGVVAGEDR